MGLHRRLNANVALITLERPGGRAPFSVFRHLGEAYIITPDAVSRRRVIDGHAAVFGRCVNRSQSCGGPRERSLDPVR